jgi:hypothetical protein
MSQSVCDPKSLRSTLCLRQPLAIARGRVPLRDLGSVGSMVGTCYYGGRLHPQEGGRMPDYP